MSKPASRPIASAVAASAAKAPAAPERLEALLAEVRACSFCAPDLPLGPRPTLRAAATARLLIVGQAPGTKVHASGIPWDDASGDRLRAWLDVDRETFYDPARIAIIPIGLCYPGRGRGGDRPPRPECAPRWMDRLLAELPERRLTLLIGRYAQAWFLGARRERSLTATVANWREYAPDFLPLVHPSPRNQMWLRRNPWFEAEIVPMLRRRTAPLLDAAGQPGSARTKRA